MNRFFIIFLGLLILGASMTLTSCSQTKEKVMESETISIAANAQGNYHDLRIGVGYIGDDPEILSAQGKHILSAQLWPFLHEEDTGRSPLLLHKGDQVDIVNYHLEIKKIDRDSVTIKFSQVDAIE